MITFGETNNITNDFVSGSDYPLPDVGPDLPALNWVMSAIGSTGSGKTTSCINIIKEYQKKKAFTTIALISPTAFPNPDSKCGYTPETKWAKNVEVDELYDKLTVSVINKIKENQNKKIDDYIDYLNDLELYKRIMKGDETLPEDVIIDYYNRNGFSKPTCQYSHIPTLLIILDDLASDNRSGQLADFASKSRHSCACLMVLAQSITQLSPILRQQSSVFMLFKTASENVINKFFEEASNSDMLIEEWIEIMGLPKTKREFIMINLKEGDINKRYRLNFNQYLIPSGIKKKDNIIYDNHASIEPGASKGKEGKGNKTKGNKTHG